MVHCHVQQQGMQELQQWVRDCQVVFVMWVQNQAQDAPAGEGE